MWDSIVLCPLLLLGQAGVPALLPGQNSSAQKPAESLPAPVEIVAPLLPEVPKPAAHEVAAASATTPDRWLFMKALQGTWTGSLLDGHRMSISGWTEASFTASTANASNQPVVWNDRANEFLLQQHWIRFERSLVTSGTTDPSFGFRTDVLIGSDYRFTLPRGLLNSQLLDSQFNSDPTHQNLYGVDPIAFYTSAYVPTLFQGTEFRFGRQYCPFGVESLEAVSTPLLSRSYAFNWSPPFTHFGLMMLSTLSPEWMLQLMVVNGNDVFLDPAQEMRFVGRLQWTSPNKRDTVAVGTSIGRGKFNAGDPFDPGTIGLMDEAAGRNNINVFDVVYTHIINERLNYTLEVIYGYQSSVPTTQAVGVIPGALNKDDALSGTAHWGSIVQYLNYALTPRIGSTVRLELFDDFEGQRTGYEGLYTAITVGLQFKPRKDLLIRPEIRYDYNGYRRPFNPDSTNTGREHGILTAGTDIVVRW